MSACLQYSRTGPCTATLSQRLGDLGLPVAPGSVYPLLARLERQGVVDTETRPSERGPARKYYALTAQGKRVLSDGRAEWAAITSAVGAVLYPPGHVASPIPLPPAGDVVT